MCNKIRLFNFRVEETTEFEHERVCQMCEALT